jgi:hypothetical protein
MTHGGSAQHTEAVEVLVSCESNYRLVSIKWDDGERKKAAEKVSFPDFSRRYLSHLAKLVKESGRTDH